MNLLAAAVWWDVAILALGAELVHASSGRHSTVTPPPSVRPHRAGELHLHGALFAAGGHRDRAIDALRLSLDEPGGAARIHGGRCPVPFARLLRDRGDYAEGAARPGQQLELLAAWRGPRPRHVPPAITQQLFISRKTAATHVSNILARTELKSRTQVARWAVESGLTAASSPGRATAAIVALWYGTVRC